MNERLKKLRDIIINGEHHRLRSEVCTFGLSSYRDTSLELHRRTAFRHQLMLEMQMPQFLEGERIAGLRTTADLPPVLSEAELESIKTEHFVHEQGRVCNITPDYASVIGTGLYGVMEKLKAARRAHPERSDYIDSCLISCQSVLDYADRLRMSAEAFGYYEIAKNLARVPAYPAATFHEALQSFRILHFSMWCEGDYHVTVGRFDKFMYPYYRADIDSGRLTREEALELLEEFFLTFNRDSDLYTGMQQGDNGQSIVLGGYDLRGNDEYNELSELCLEAALEMRTIDPKINLRVSDKTPLERYEFASKLTEVGMGFPQYSNDDVVVKGLCDLGYSPEDAANYVVAACWEFIVPGRGMDIPNIGALCLPDCVDKTLREYADADFEAFKAHLKLVVARETAKTAASHRSLFMCPAPFMSQFFEGRTDSGLDISQGCVYNNYGIHGTGFSNAADYMTSVEKMIYGGRISREEYIKMLDADFDGYEELREELLAIPKFGSDDDASNANANALMRYFSDACSRLTNERGGCYRAGTGSAMYYAFHGSEMSATGDGRRAGDYFAANYSPALGAKTGGPLNIIKSFTKPDLAAAINGGPLTLELSRGVTDMPEKLAPVVQSFVKLGGHQLQLNSVSREMLLNAEAEPDKYRELVVRVWGWSGYYTSLDEVYRKQILKRTEYEL